MTHEEYVERVKKVNPNIEVVGQYTDAKTKILHKCKTDGYEWCAKPNNILNGRGCPRCAKKERYTHKDYIAKVKDINNNIEVVGIYVNARTSILHRCKIDGCEWCATPDNILHGCGCPRCAGNLKYEHEEYVKKVLEINPNIEVVGMYVDGLTPILHRCKIDGCEWTARPSAILYGGGCPRCSASKGEKAIADWLQKKSILYESQKKFEDCRKVYALPFDFYLLDYNILIEYNGKQHYEPIEYFGGQKTFENQILRDNIKKEYCQKNDIFLFEIPYYSNLDNELAKLYELIKTKNMKKGVVA